MAKFQLNPGETLIGSGMMSLYLKQGLGKSLSRVISISQISGRVSKSA